MSVVLESFSNYLYAPLDVSCSTIFWSFLVSLFFNVMYCNLSSWCCPFVCVCACCCNLDIFRGFFEFVLLSFMNWNLSFVCVCCCRLDRSGIYASCTYRDDWRGVLSSSILSNFLILLDRCVLNSLRSAKSCVFREFGLLS